MEALKAILMGIFLALVVFAGASSAMPIPGAMKTFQKEMAEKKILKQDIARVIPKAKKK